MRRRRGTLLVSIAAGLAVLLAIVNIVLVELNRTVQVDVASRNQFIQQSLQLDGLRREVVTALANLAVERNDDALKAVLTEHGFNITPPAGAGRAPSTPPATQPAPQR